MATQGLLTVVKNGEVVVKVITGCDGYNMPKLESRILEGGLPFSLHQLYECARGLGIGCDDCLVVMSADDTFHRCDDELSPSYRETFSKPKWNPRWDVGSADYNLVVEVQ